MNQKTVFIAGFIGLVFGFLFSGTLGISFFEKDDPINDDYNQQQGDTLKKDEEAFKVAYNLTESIYVPITGTEAYNKIDNSETFILYAGRDTCPYCQQYVPVLMTAAENLDISVIYHVDTIDPLNDMFVTDENVYLTPTTFIYKDGVLVETIIGYQTQTQTETLINDALN